MVEYVDGRGASPGTTDVSIANYAGRTPPRWLTALL